MKIGQLIEKLKQYDPEMEVLLDQPTYYQEIREEHIFVQHVSLSQPKDDYHHFATYMPCGCPEEHQDKNEEGVPNITALLIGDVS